MWSAMCDNPKCFAYTEAFKTKKEAVERWNNRPAEEAKTAKIAELEAERDRMREALEKIAQWDMLARSQKGLIAIIEVLKDTARETLEGTGE